MSLASLPRAEAVRRQLPVPDSIAATAEHQPDATQLDVLHENFEEDFDNVEYLPDTAPYPRQPTKSGVRSSVRQVAQKQAEQAWICPICRMHIQIPPSCDAR